MFNKKKDQYSDLRKNAIELTDKLASLPTDAPDRADVRASAKRAQRNLFQAMLDAKIDAFVAEWLELSALVKLASDWGTLPRKSIVHNAVDYVTQRRTLKIKDVDDKAAEIRRKALGR